MGLLVGFTISRFFPQKSLCRVGGPENIRNLMGWVGSDRVGSCRVVSGQDISNIKGPTQPKRSDLTREKILIVPPAPLFIVRRSFCGFNSFLGSGRLSPLGVGAILLLFR